MPTITTWETNPVEVGPLYPGVGSELGLWLVCVAAWLGWTLWQMKAEGREFRDEVNELHREGLESIVRCRRGSSP